MKKRRYKKNPSPVATVAIVGGAGIIGYILYRHFSQPVYAPAAPSAPKPGLFETILGTGLSLVASERDKQIAAAKAGTTPKGPFQFQSSLFGTAPQCVDTSTKKAVADSYCGAKAVAGLGGFTRGPMGAFGARSFRDPTVPMSGTQSYGHVFSSPGRKGSLG